MPVESSRIIVSINTTVIAKCPGGRRPPVIKLLCSGIVLREHFISVDLLDFLLCEWCDIGRERVLAHKRNFWHYGRHFSLTLDCLSARNLSESSPVEAD
jgi:hypothetical protein